LRLKNDFWSGSLGAARTETGDAFGPKGLGSVRRVPDIRMSCKMRFGTEDSQTHPIPRGWANERFVILVHPMKVYALNKGFHRHKLGKEVYFEKQIGYGLESKSQHLIFPQDEWIIMENFGSYHPSWFEGGKAPTWGVFRKTFSAQRLTKTFHQAISKHKAAR